MTVETHHHGKTVPLLRLRGISKSYPGVQALQGVDLDLEAGEVLAVLGENGAGKSTLIKVLGGAHRPESGTLELGGQAVTIPHPYAARHSGIAVIYQEFNLVPAMTARENLFLGNEPRWCGFVRTTQERQQARELLNRLGVELDMERRCRDLSVAHQQVVEIARALSIRARIIVMDEPTTALSSREVERLFVIIRELKAQGIGVIYVSHRLDEIFEIADRVTVLRDGRHVATRRIQDVTRRGLIELMVGRSTESEFPQRTATIGEICLHVSGLCCGREVRDVSFSVRRGEVVALTGLVGSGRTETARLIFGADRRDSGTIAVDGSVRQIRHPRDAIAAGICLLTEDRKSQGLLLNRSVQENFGLPNLSHFARGGLINSRLERTALQRYVDKFRIRLAGPRQLARHLSGGNQQKIVLAKWLEQNSEVILIDEPTRGIDVGARFEIYTLINELAAQGKAILMISSELPEVLGMADRILVMHDGRISGEIPDVAQATQTRILELAVS